ncbi:MULTISPECIES: multicopper oxidase domain-containing protein [unclassified Colwellia]|uniref:multicopper oxidase domain-containing protein n=1 Tax=unclassified Colwellia TaxID=196834 RepID=UPI002872F000|nr:MULTISPECIES: multicopper oxidase domain-containing protein [unclassified Colwellia]
MDPLPILSMTDMGMEMDGMDQSGQDMLTGMQMNGKNQNDNDMSGGMQMGQDVSNAYYSKNAQTMSNMNVNLDDEQIPMDMNPKLPLIDVPEKEGPQIAMRATGAKYRLDDPGVGLRNNGRKVLTYADLKNLYPTRHEPKPTKQLLLHLTGNMERYMWSINGIPYGEAQPLKFNFGERIRVTFINDTMMNHPMHLHGVWSDLETGDENHIPRKHTIVVQPGSKISYRVTMNARGDWAYHCHMLYHMMGMFRRVQIR